MCEAKPGSSPSTMSLVARVREGSEEAKRILWDLYQPVFLRHAQHHQSLRHLRRTHDAEDLTQEAWRRVFAYDAMDRFRYRGQGSLGHFLKDIVEKTILDCVRAMQAVKRAGERADIELAETALAGGGMTASALSAAAASELMERCKELLDCTKRGSGSAAPLRLAVGLRSSRAAARPRASSIYQQESGVVPRARSSTSDYYWGCGQTGTGENRLGKILMAVREEIRQDA